MTSRGRLKRTRSLPETATPWPFVRSGSLASGAFGDTKRLIGPLMHKEPKGIGEIRAELRALEYRVFQGVIHKHQWPFWSRVFFHAFGGRFGDHRDWPTIDAWADRIAAALPSLRSTSQV